MKVSELTALATIASILAEDPIKKEALSTLARGLLELVKAEEDIVAFEQTIYDKNAKVYEALESVYRAKAAIEKDKSDLLERKLAFERRILDVLRKFL